MAYGVAQQFGISDNDDWNAKYGDYIYICIHIHTHIHTHTKVDTFPNAGDKFQYLISGGLRSLILKK